jgi:uncharacterized lipoprotein
MSSIDKNSGVQTLWLGSKPNDRVALRAIVIRIVAVVLLLGLAGCTLGTGNTRYFNGVLVASRLTGTANAPKAIVADWSGCARGFAYKLRNEAIGGRVEAFARARAPTAPIAAVVAATTAQAAVLAFTPAQNGGDAVQVRLFATATNRPVWHAVIPVDRFISEEGSAITCQNLLATTLSQLHEANIYFEINPLLFNRPWY